MTRFRRKFWIMSALLSAATVFQYLPTSCLQLYYNAGAAAFNFCAVLNCTGGTYFDLCSPVVILVDCLNAG